MGKIMTLSIAMIAMTLFTGCKKYEEGPVLSLKSRKARVANVWKVESAKENGSDVTSDYDSYIETYEKDGKYSVNTGGTISVTAEGRWEFRNKDEEIRIYDAGVADRILYILRLTENEFWYYYYDGTDKIEIHLKPKA